MGLASLLRQIEGLEQEVKEVDKAVNALAESERYRAAADALVDKLTGVAVLSAMVFLTEMGGPAPIREPQAGRGLHGRRAVQ